MDPALIPPFGLKSTYCRTPNNGLLYISGKHQEVIYIESPGANRMFPKFKVILSPAKIYFECLAVDPIWEEHRQEFVAVDENQKVFVLDVKAPTTLKTHNVHFLDLKRSAGRFNHQIALCYTYNRHILSVDRKAFVNFDVDANTYTSQSSGWLFKHNIKIMAASPHNMDLFAAGTKNGLVLVASLKAMTLIHQMRDHDSEIVSLSWTILEQTVVSQNEHLQMPTPPPVKTQQPIAVDPQADDDLFDVYSYDHLENEFGTYAGNNPGPESDDEETKQSNKVEVVEGNENFDFVEACSNLKDMILQNDDATATVTTDIDELCSKVEHIFDENAVAGDDTTFPNRPPVGSSDVDTSNVSCASNNSGAASPPEVIETVKRVLVVSSCSRSLTWVWDAETGEALEKIKITQRKVSARTAKATTQLLWISNDTVLSHTNHIQLWKLGFNDDNRLIVTQIYRDFVHIDYHSIVTGHYNPFQTDPSTDLWLFTTAGLQCIGIHGDEIKDLLTTPMTAIDVQAIEVNALESNLVALTSNRQIAVLNMSNIAANSIGGTVQISMGVQSPVYALAWHPEKAHVLAFSTKEGRIGIVNINRPSSLVYMRPKFNCTVYSLAWGTVCDHITKVPTIVLISCANKEIVYFMDSGENKHNPICMRVNARDPKHIKIAGRHMLVGNNEGFFSICDLQDNKKFLYGQSLGKKYIASIDSHQNKLAVATMCGQVILLDISSMDDVTKTPFVGHTDGVVSVRFSADGSKMVTTSYDCTVRVWNTAEPSSCRVFNFHCFMYAAVFSALNPNMIVCGGIRSGTILLDITSENQDLRPLFCQIEQSQSNRAIAGAVEPMVEGTEDAADKQNKRNRRVRGGGAAEAGDSAIQESIVAADEARPALVEDDQHTMLFLCTKEMNRDPLIVLKRCIELRTETGEKTVHRPLLNEQFFSTRECLRTLLDTELQNNKKSTVKSAGNLLLPQITGHLKEEILHRLTTKTMTDEYLALAPNVSYVFWRDCCRAYGLQLIEKGLILKAMTYLWSCNDINETINQLCAAKFYREAYCVARLRKEDDDPILSDILGKWSDQYENHGALEAAATILCVNRQFGLAKCVLQKRRTPTAMHEEVLAMLSQLI